MIDPAPWSEGLIAAALARQTFASKSLVMLPNCTWTGYEMDLLVVTMDMRLIDVEVKISRADLKADAGKDKWWHRQPYYYPMIRDEGGRMIQPPAVHREWPPRVWKHYYAMPADIWKPELIETLGSTSSGVLLLHRSPTTRARVRVVCERRSRPNRQAEKIGANHAINLARLASLRMWDVIQGRPS